MNLIEKLGGYEKAKAFLNATSFTIDELIMIQRSGLRTQHVEKALLEYRRQHNIYEVGDLITHPVFWGLFQVKETMKHHVLGVTSTGYESKLAMELIRHANNEEIKAGKRLEVNQ